jgi:opacity protein-like surface antigen
MIKRNLFYFLLILPIIASAQQTQTVPASPSTKGIFFDASAGLSLPLGAYAGSDEGNEQSGFSRNGFIVQLACDWMGKKDFGLALQYTFQLNPFKNTSKDSILPGMSVPLGSGNWANHYIMAGPVYMKYFKKILFEAKVLIGVIISTSPLFKTEDPAFKTVSDNTGTGFAFGIGAGAGYRLSSSVALKLNAEYLIGTPKIDRQYGAQIIGYRDSAFVYSPPVNFDTKKVVSSFNLGLSIIFRIPG